MDHPDPFATFRGDPEPSAATNPKITTHAYDRDLVMGVNLHWPDGRVLGGCYLTAVETAALARELEHAWEVIRDPAF